ncbi:MAG: hypothetical protein JO297_13760 [Nitrososphaeraceae archaeon]|nr:hypothetical protein [Nitrososphaeraceae archaeon]
MIGIKGMSGIKRMLVGSVVQNVTTYVHYPVLVIE